MTMLLVVLFPVADVKFVKAVATLVVVDPVKLSAKTNTSPTNPDEIATRRLLSPVAGETSP
jgi:hypothetical protein